jgi:hypothetical protein
MERKTMRFINKLMAQSDIDAQEGSTRVDQSVVEAFVANPDNPFLVSFPRTGSHWLRMLMELYFERPSLVRVFYYPEKKDYMFLHTHDMDLDVERTHVIYLYRDPVDTIYSQLNYRKDNPDDPARIEHWSDVYGQHLDKWLHQETFTTKKIILTYEEMKRDLASAFSHITDYFDQPLNREQLEQVAPRVTRNEVKRKTSHDSQVVQLDAGYDMSRETFRERHSDLVWAILLRDRAHLAQDFPPRK